MKKNIVVCICLFILTVPVFSQIIDKAQYTAIDPYDYKLEEDKPPPRSRIIKYYKSVVEFVSEVKDNDALIYQFISLDKRTPLRLKPNPESKLRPPSPGQTVTVYYTMNKLRSVSVVLDAFEDNRNKDEKGLGVEKSSIPSSSNIKKSDYVLITPDDYSDDAFFTQEGDDDRKFYATLQFVSQEGILFSFSNPENTNEKQVFLKMKAGRRYPVYTVGQKMVVFFTATKEAKDYLRLDDIEVRN
jgi:hypothetical protein